MGTAASAANAAARAFRPAGFLPLPAGAAEPLTVVTWVRACPACMPEGQHHVDSVDCLPMNVLGNVPVYASGAGTAAVNFQPALSVGGINPPSQCRSAALPLSCRC